MVCIKIRLSIHLQVNHYLVYSCVTAGGTNQKGTAKGVHEICEPDQEKFEEFLIDIFSLFFYQIFLTVVQVFFQPKALLWFFSKVRNVRVEVKGNIRKQKL